MGPDATRKYSTLVVAGNGYAYRREGISPCVTTKAARFLWYREDEEGRPKPYCRLSANDALSLQGMPHVDHAVRVDHRLHASPQFDERACPSGNNGSHAEELN